MLRLGEEHFFQVLFNDDLWKELKKWIRESYKDKRSCNFYDYVDGDIAATNGYLGLIQQSKQLIFTNVAVDEACANNHLQVAQYLYYNRTEGCTIAAIKIAITNGHLEVVKWLYEVVNIQGDLSTVLDLAVINGHQHIVEYLIDKFLLKDISSAAQAIKNGHINVVKFLTNNGISNLIPLINTAAEINDIELVKYFYSKRISFLTMDQSTIDNIKQLKTNPYFYDIICGNYEPVTINIILKLVQPNIPTY